MILLVNDLRLENFARLIRTRAWVNCDIATRYINFRKAARVKPVIREVVLSDSLIGCTTTIIQQDGFVRTVEWDRILYDRGGLSSWQTYKGNRKFEKAYNKGDKVLMLVGWK